MPARYSETSGRSSPERHIVGVPPAETVSTGRPRRRSSAAAASRNARAPGGDGKVSRPAKRRPCVRAIAAASPAASSGEPTPVRPRPVSQSTSTPSSRARVRRRAGETGEQRRVVGGDRDLARPSSGASCSSFRPPTTLYGTRTSSIPASTITSASCRVWHVTPPAPSSTCRRAISTHLCVFTCGRLARPTRSQCSCQRARLASSRSRSTTAAGVSDVEGHAALRRPPAGPGRGVEDVRLVHARAERDLRLALGRRRVSVRATSLTGSPP